MNCCKKMLPWNEDAPAGQCWKCPDCDSWATLGGNAAYHASSTGHAYPSLQDLAPDPRAAAEADLLGQAMYCLLQIVQMLPSRRDWLDPDIEKLARAVLSQAKEAEPPAKPSDAS